MERIRRGEDAFDVAAREQLAELRRRERVFREEREVLEELVEQAKQSVLARRSPRHRTPEPEAATLWFPSRSPR